MLIAWIAIIGPHRLSTYDLSCQRSHGYTITKAHREEVKVCAEALAASTPLSGAAAAAPPAGAGGGCSSIARSIAIDIEIFFNMY
jgi:hypothetical protein